MDKVQLSILTNRGLVKWYNNGLQNHCWEFDSLIPCHILNKFQFWIKKIEKKGLINTLIYYPFCVQGGFSFLSITKLDDLYLYIFCVIGIFISILWFLTIDNYSKRNKVKYQIINEYEQQKNLNWFREEEKGIGKHMIYLSVTHGSIIINIIT